MKFTQDLDIGMATARGQTAGTFELLRNRRLMQSEGGGVVLLVPFPVPIVMLRTSENGARRSDPTALAQADEPGGADPRDKGDRLVPHLPRPGQGEPRPLAERGRGREVLT